jgi:hypothetical protein
MGQTLDILRETIAVKALDRGDDAGVERTPAFVQQAAVGYVVSERVFERVLEVGKRRVS